MRPEKIKLALALFVLLIFFIGRPSHAQSEQPVQVNMDVLNALNPANTQSRYVSPPATAIKRPSKRALTGQSVVKFPIQVKKRTNAYDPSLAKARNYVDVPVKKKQKQATDIISPALKPVKVAVQRYIVKVPIPPRRPDILKVSDLSMGGLNMPAVPPQDVQSEPLHPPALKSPIKVASNDALAESLIIPDRNAMVSSIEIIAALADALAPVKRTKTIASTKHVSALTSVPLPARKPEIASSVMIAKIDKALDMAAIEPAAGENETKVASLIDITEAAPAEKSHENRIPRNPPENDFEQEYISMAFEPSITAINENTAGSLNKDIIPLLKNNPQWRLQIQAFAGKTDESLKNARRVSLSRALSVRSHLLDQGIEARRMDVRALGMQTDRNPVDRVDFVFFDPNAVN